MTEDQHKCGLWCRVYGCRSMPADPNSAFLDGFHHDHLVTANLLDAYFEASEELGQNHHSEPSEEYLNGYFEGDLGRITTRP